MRIAFSGTHRVGKSTLVEQIALVQPDFTSVEEPYHLLEEDGHEFGWPPSTEDFQVQLDRSIAQVQASGERTLFDRCPADLLAYLAVHGEDIEESLEQSRTAMRMLDLVVLVPLEEPDVIAVAAHEDQQQRRAVAEMLESLLYDDELAQNVITVQGDLTARVKQVQAALTQAIWTATTSARRRPE